ncbi:hypothetical protein F5148DRAFT_1378062 [Russula earlei]|uniref:Uncharacterized protein n=1 Tax=Russula earlei TaxID=71964 RepID=A0ACC0U1F0_9AGAM|nr:hypothetical protein F5148DRAFT_1378062 [Russula earlei]
MTLLTPPHSRSDKENRRASPAIHARVAWSQVNEYHSVASPTGTRKPAGSASKELPLRSILKQTPYPILPLLFLENKRQVTPEPGDPLSDLHYLDGPVNKILAQCSTLPDLIEAYSVLTARLRAAVQETTDNNCSWPLFQPIRKHRMAFLDRVVRDLARPLSDPMDGNDRLGCTIPEPPPALPSPEKSPRKRRCGMNEEQVKYARDLATVSHAVMKFLGLVFTLPAVYTQFDYQHLGSMVTQALAIPLAPELPTLNARKTCALAIWLIQTQRLPAEVLGPAKDRIAYALRRAIEGELGKEGKKGSVCDGLKAIHDLSIHEPSIFVPAFTELLPSILDNLLAPRLALRAQACHALSGLALGASQIPLSHAHTRLSEIVVATLTVDPAPPTTSSPSTPSASKSDSMLIKTLRTTLASHDPTCAAQGPVWALCTLAALIVLLGPALVTSTKLTNVVKGLLALSIRHKKSSVRALACAVWRPLVWAYFRPPFLRKGDERDEEGWEDEPVTTAAAWTRAEEARRDDFWKVVATVVDMGAGVSTVGALLAHKSDDAHRVSRAIALLESMVQRGGNMCHDAVQTLCRLVSTQCDTVPSPQVKDKQEAEMNEDGDADWDWGKLLPKGLFSADPGLLTVDFASLSEEVRQVLRQTSTEADVCALNAVELWMPGVMDGLIKVWRSALTQVCLSSDAELPPELVQSWKGLLKAALRGLQSSPDASDDEDGQEGGLVRKLAELAVSLMQDILGDPKVQLVPSGDPEAPSQIASEVDLAPHTRSNAAMKLAVVRTLWGHAHAILPMQALAGTPSEALLTWLIEREAELVWETDTPHDARTQWAMLCAEVLLRTSVSGSTLAPALLRMFWGTPSASRRWVWSWETDVRARVWRVFAERWRTLAVGWEEALVLLSVPFCDKDGWEMNTEDLDAWDATLQVCLARALDDGGDTTRMLDHLASTIASTHIPTGTSATHAAELLLGHAEVPTDAPALLGFVNDTLVSIYPPGPRNRVASLWLIRAVTRVVDRCPVKKLREVVGSLQEGLSVWVADQYRVLTVEEYTFDVVPLYETIMVCLQSLGSSIDTLKSLGPLLEAGFIGREDKPQGIVHAFQDYWDLTYAEVTIPKAGWPSPVMTCLKACGREVHLIPAPLRAETADVVHSKRTLIPTLESAFTWSSSSTIAVDEDDTSDGTEPSQESNAFASFTKEMELVSTPKAAPTMSSPRRPSKNAILPTVIFSPLAPTKLDFVMRPVSPSSPSRPPRSPVHSPRKVSDGSDKENTPPKQRPRPATAMAMASLSTPKLGKRRASNGLTDSRPTKKQRGGHVAVKSNDDDDDSEAEREEVRQSLLRPVTPSPATDSHHPPHPAAVRVFTSSTVPRALPQPWPELSSLRASPTPQPVRHKLKRKGVFMDAVEVPKLVLRRTKSRSSASYVRMQTCQTSASTPSLAISVELPPPPQQQHEQPRPVVRRSLRRAKSLVTGVGAGVLERPVISAAKRRSSGKRQNVSADVADATAYDEVIVVKAEKMVWAEPDSNDDDVAAGRPSQGSSSPISASLRQARVLFGSDDSMATELDNHGGTAPPCCESSDDDPHLGHVTPHHILSPIPRRVSSRIFAIHEKA